MYTVSTKQYADLLERCYNAKSPLFVFGGPGIGKSEIPRQVFTKTANEMKRQFVEWTDLTKEQKFDCIKNPEKYWVFCDQRVGQMDSTDLRGIPNMINAEMLETIPMSWVIYFTTKGAAGSIFFDELNLAPPTVAGQAYQIINERTISDRRLSDDVFVFGAGNRESDQAFVHQMPFPLRDRFNEFEIEPNVELWTHEYATPKKINPHLVAFIQWKNSYLYKVSDKSANKSSTPRGITRASNLIGNLDVTSNDVHMLVSIAVGEAFATEFQAYVKHYSSLNWNKIFSNPETVTDMSVDKLWAIVGGLSEHFNKIGDKVVKESQNAFNNIMGVIEHLRPDFAIVSLKLIKDSEPKKFGKYITKFKGLNMIVQKYGKFVL